jgi:hypothetical protein
MANRCHHQTKERWSDAADGSHLSVSSSALERIASHAANEPQSASSQIDLQQQQFCPWGYDLSSLKCASCLLCQWHSNMASNSACRRPPKLSHFAIAKVVATQRFKECTMTHNHHSLLSQRVNPLPKCRRASASPFSIHGFAFCPNLLQLPEPLPRLDKWKSFEQLGLPRARVAGSDDSLAVTLCEKHATGTSLLTKCQSSCLNSPRER